MNDDQQRVRDCAYFIWQHEGCPEGRDEEFWQRALLRVAAEDAAVPDNLVSPAHDAGDEALRDTFPASDPPSFTASRGPSP